MFAVVVLCGMDDFVREFMLAANDKDMTSGDYVYILTHLLPPDDLLTPWVMNDSFDDNAKKAYFPLLQVHVYHALCTQHKYFLGDSIIYIL